MKNGKEEILSNKEQSTEQSKEQSTEQSSLQSSVQSSVESNRVYVYGVGILFVLAIGVCVFFTYNKKVHEEPIKLKRRHML